MRVSHTTRTAAAAGGGACQRPSDRYPDSLHPPLDPHHPPEASAGSGPVFTPAPVCLARRLRDAVLSAGPRAVVPLGVAARIGSSRKETDSC